MRTHIKKAFTLLELIIVLVVLGILAAIVIPQFTQVTERAEVSAAARSAEAFDREVRNLAGFDAHKASPLGDARNPEYLNAADEDVDGVTVVGISDTTSNNLDDDGVVYLVEGTDAICEEGESVARVTYDSDSDGSHRAGEPADIASAICVADYTAGDTGTSATGDYSAATVPDATFQDA